MIQRTRQDLIQDNSMVLRLSHWMKNATGLLVRGWGSGRVRCYFPESVHAAQGRGQVEYVDTRDVRTSMTPCGEPLLILIHLDEGVRS